MYSNYSLSEIRTAQNQMDGIFSTITGIIGKAGSALSKIGTLATGAAQAGVNAGFINPSSAASIAAQQQALLAQQQFLAQQNLANQRSGEIPPWLIPAAIGAVGLILTLSRRK